VVLLRINPHSKFEVLSFTNSKDMIGAKFKKRVTFIPRLAIDKSACIQNLANIASAVPEI